MCHIRSVQSGPDGASCTRLAHQLHDDARTHTRAYPQTLWLLHGVFIVGKKVELNKYYCKSHQIQIFCCIILNFKQYGKEINKPAAEASTTTEAIATKIIQYIYSIGYYRCFSSIRFGCSGKKGRERLCNTETEHNFFLMETLTVSRI